MHSFICKQATAPTKKAASFSTGGVSSSPIRQIYQTKNPHTATGSSFNVGMGHCWNVTDGYKSIQTAKKTCPSVKTLSTTNPARTGLGSKPDVFSTTPTTIRVSRGTARIAGGIHSTIWFFCFSVKLRIDELCKQPEKMMVHLYPTRKSGIHGVSTSSQWGVLRHGNKPHLIKDLTTQKFPFQISLCITTHTIQR